MPLSNRGAIQDDQLHERQGDDHCDHETENDRNKLLEALVNGHDRPMLTCFRKELPRRVAFVSMCRSVLALRSNGSALNGPPEPQ